MTAEHEVTTTRMYSSVLSPERLLELYRWMLLTRALDERIWRLNRQGKVPFAIPARGQEAAQVGSAYALRAGHDLALPYPRDLGVVLVLGMTPLEVLLSALARADDPSSGGRQLPMHWGHARLRMLSSSSPVGTQIPQAAGLALAAKLRREDSVIVVYFGDGATSKGDFHEGLNFAAIHTLPVVFFCQNNGYATSVPQSLQMAIPDVADYAPAYGMPGVIVDGNDVLAVYAETRAAVDRARRGDGPTLLEAKTYRLLPHTSDDDDGRYRDPAEVVYWEARDPLPRFRAELVAAGLLDDAVDAGLLAQAQAQIDDALVRAEASPIPKRLLALDHILADEIDDGSAALQR
ncbi:MAG: thiamine pyrophosphate-dependent dehydrogenase E1 component subunit alpha [Chloroflexi bacterium]|nr:thiamine pyrophosphate-dependent dehydrogenase E1 component subunit alpha [Chloroflexota bacterium]